MPLILLTSFVVGWVLTQGLPGELTSFDGVLLGFSTPEKVLNAWIEVLGLALLVGRWMIDDGVEKGLPRILVLIALVASFLAAALGLILYLGLRLVMVGSDRVKRELGP